MKREQRGQGVVEFALVLPVLALLLAGIIDLTDGYLTYVSLENAAREGAAYGANPDNQSSVCARVNQALPGSTDTNWVPGKVNLNNITCSPSYPGISGDANCPEGSYKAGCPIRVEVRYTLGLTNSSPPNQAETPPVFLGSVLGFSTIPLHASIDMMVISTGT